MKIKKIFNLKKRAQVKPGKPVKPATTFMRIGLPP
jgi:hypothetical protein